MEISSSDALYIKIIYSFHQRRRHFTCMTHNARSDWRRKQKYFNIIYKI